MNVLDLINVVLAIMGLYVVVILVVQRFQHKGFAAARWYVNELLKDFICNRNYFRLEHSDFPIKLTNDISVYLTGNDNERWRRRFSMLSQCMEESGTTPYGLPYYQFKVLFTSEDSKKVYEEMVRTLSQSALLFANCTERRVIIEWIPTAESDYQICRVIYARTAAEQEKFRKVIEYTDSAILNIESNGVTDEDLNTELKKFGDKNE